jgi:hypothetical protein
MHLSLFRGKSVCLPAAAVRISRMKDTIIR